jgi:membrane protease YdiL (CAAX protease family)
VVAWLLAFTVSIALAVVARTLLPVAQPPEFKLEGAYALFMLVVFAPILETLIMGGVLLVLTALFRRELAVIVSAILWGAAHSAMAPMWGLVIWWPFLIFSVLFVTWRQRSLAAAFAVPAAAHALQNLMPALVIAFGGPPA